jgi:hypothetical protein
MNALDAEREDLPVYLERYAAELDAMRRTTTAARTNRNVANEVRIHPKGRGPFARIDAVLNPVRPHAYDDGGRLKSAQAIPNSKPNSLSRS